MPREIWTRTSWFMERQINLRAHRLFSARRPFPDESQAGGSLNIVRLRIGWWYRHLISEQAYDGCVLVLSIQNTIK